MAPQKGDKNAKETCTLTIDDQQIRPTRNLKILGINIRSVRGHDHTNIWKLGGSDIHV